MEEMALSLFYFVSDGAKEALGEWHMPPVKVCW
jgi:hypothetical protein